MNRNLAARCLAVAFIVVSYAAYIRHDIENMRRTGRDQFLASRAAAQARRFDRLSETRVPNFIAFFGAFFVGVPLFLLYELLAFAARKVLKSLGAGIEPPPAVPSPGLPFS